MFIRSINRTFGRQCCARRISSSAREYKVVLDNDTLYIEQPIAEALGWKRDLPPSGTKLALRGWEPHYFTITQCGTDSDALAERTIQDSHNPKVQEVLKLLKEYDAQS